MFTLPVGMMFSFVSRGDQRDMAGGTSQFPQLMVPSSSQLLPPAPLGGIFVQNLGAL